MELLELLYLLVQCQKKYNRRIIINGQAQEVCKKGIHPVKIADGYEQACKIAVDYLREISSTITFSEDNIEPLVEVALTTLSSKIVNKYFFLQ